MARQKSQSKLTKTANQVETDDLLELLEKSDEVIEEAVEYPNNILEFIAIFNIEPGRFPVKKHTMYNIYKVWAEEPVPKQAFAIEMGRYFPDKRDSRDIKYYLINKNAIKLTHAAYKYYNSPEYNKRKVKKASRLRHFEQFLKYHSLEQGEYWIHQEVLLYLYERYCDMVGIKPSQKTIYLHPIQFVKYARQTLKNKRTKHGNYYAVSNNIEQFFMIGQVQKLNEKYAKKKQKKSNKTSKSRTETQS